jgi:hypothetical protein
MAAAIQRGALPPMRPLLRSNRMVMASNRRSQIGYATRTLRSARELCGSFQPGRMAYTQARRPMPTVTVSASTSAAQSGRRRSCLTMRPRATAQAG